MTATLEVIRLRLSRGCITSSCRLYSNTDMPLAFLHLFCQAKPSAVAALATCKVARGNHRCSPHQDQPEEYLTVSWLPDGLAWWSLSNTPWTSFHNILDSMCMLPLICDQKPVRVVTGALHMLTYTTAAVCAFVIAAGVDISLDHLLTILTPPANGAGIWARCKPTSSRLHAGAYR